MAGSRSDPDDDARLVREVAAGSETALAELYDRYVGLVFATARRLSSDPQLAEDVVQETFLALWNRADQFQPDLGSLPGWLATIARNRTVDRLRAAGRRPTVISISATQRGDETDAATLERIARDGAVVGAASGGQDPALEFAGGELRSALAGALEAMSEPERRILVMAYRDGLTQREIAERLGWPLGTVKTRTRRAFLKLRTVLGPDYGPAPGPGAAFESDEPDPFGGPAPAGSVAPDPTAGSPSTNLEMEGTMEGTQPVVPRATVSPRPGEPSRHSISIGPSADRGS